MATVRHGIRAEAKDLEQAAAPPRGAEHLVTRPRGRIRREAAPPAGRPTGDIVTRVQTKRREAIGSSTQDCSEITAAGVL